MPAERGLTASLPMYAPPPLRPAWQALWSALLADLRTVLPGLPERLDWPSDLTAHWRAGDLGLSQTCAMPYRQGLFRQTEVLGAFDLALPSCPPGDYNSVLIVQAGDRRAALAEFAGAVPAVNDLASQSGTAALFAAAGSAGIALGAPLVTGSHAASIRAVASGRADLAAIDAQSWRIALRLGETGDVREIARTPPTPGLPLICRRGAPAPALRAALAEAIADLPDHIAAPLDIGGFVPRTAHHYLTAPLAPGADP